MERLIDQLREQKEWERLTDGSQTNHEENVDALTDEQDDGCQHVSKTTSLLWVYLYRCSKLGSRSLWKKKKNVSLEEQIRALTDKVIQHRLSQANSTDNILSRKINKPIRQDIVQCFCNMTDVIIAANPNLYCDIALKLNVTFHEERSVCKAFSDFAEILFSKAQTWPLMVSLFAFASSLSVECSKNGRSILVKNISDWTTIFIVMRLKEWIIKNGKWDGALEYFQPKQQSSGAFLSDILGKLHTFEQPLQRGFAGSVMIIGAYTIYSAGCAINHLLGG